MNVGELIKSLRVKRGVSIKKLAPELGLDYTYISKIENSKINPSSKVVKKFADYFSYNVDELLMMAGRVPDDIQKILEDNPKEAVKFLRRKFAQ